MTHFDSPEKDVLLATAIAAGASASAAAQQLQVSLSTVHRRLAEPSFRKLVFDLRAEMVASALGFMTDNLIRAAKSTAELLDAPQPHIRLRAARTLFNFAMRLREAVDVDQRFRDIEEELARKQGVLR
jgi:hypothetical protein